MTSKHSTTPEEVSTCIVQTNLSLLEALRHDGTWCWVLCGSEILSHFIEG